MAFLENLNVKDVRNCSIDWQKPKKNRFRRLVGIKNRFLSTYIFMNTESIFYADQMLWLSQESILLKKANSSIYSLQFTYNAIVLTYNVFRLKFLGGDWILFFSWEKLSAFLKLSRRGKRSFVPTKLTSFGNSALLSGTIACLS